MTKKTNPIEAHQRRKRGQVVLWYSWFIDEELK